MEDQDEGNAHIFFEDDGLSIRIVLGSRPQFRDELNQITNEEIIPWIRRKMDSPDHLAILERIENVYFDGFNRMTLLLLESLVPVYEWLAERGGDNNNDRTFVDDYFVLLYDHPSTSFLKVIAQALPNLKRTFVAPSEKYLEDNFVLAYHIRLLLEIFPSAICLRHGVNSWCSVQINTNNNPTDENEVVHLIRGLFEIPQQALVHDLRVPMRYFLSISEWISNNQNRWNEIWNEDIGDTIVSSLTNLYIERPRLGLAPRHRQHPPWR